MATGASFALDGCGLQLGLVYELTRPSAAITRLILRLEAVTPLAARRILMRGAPYSPRLSRHMATTSPVIGSGVRGLSGFLSVQ